MYVRDDDGRWVHHAVFVLRKQRRKTSFLKLRRGTLKAFPEIKGVVLHDSTVPWRHQWWAKIRIYVTLRKAYLVLAFNNFKRKFHV